MIKPVVMAGESGAWLCPPSHAGHPKQFLELNGEKSMFQQSAERLSGLPASESITVCIGRPRFFVAEQLREIDPLGKIRLEPIGRDTSPAIGLVALLEKEDGPQINGRIDWLLPKHLKDKKLK